MSTLSNAIAVGLVTIATLAIGTWGMRFSRTTSDFFVASRTVRPGLNASAIGGEYLSAASFLGVAGLVLAFGADMLWYPVGWTAGYLFLLVLVAAPLRRSGAYTLPDFAEARFGSRPLRLLASGMVAVIGWLYLIPQYQGAGLVMRTALGTPDWFGPVLVMVVVLINVTSGGMRSITFVQAFQYWIKLTALLIPAVVLLMIWLGDGAPSAVSISSPTNGDGSWSLPVGGGGLPGLYLTYSLIIATFLGTMGLPHVVVRFYTNPDGRTARRTTVAVLALLGVFYMLPPVYAALGRIYAPDANPDAVVLQLPGIMLDGRAGDALTALVTAGAVAAFLSTSSGLTIAVAGVISQDLASHRWLSRLARLGGVASFRLATVIAVAVPTICALVIPGLGIARAVGLAFAVAASTFCPLLVLGIWWRGFTDLGAIAGLVTGLTTSGTGVVYAIIDPSLAPWGEALLSQPAAWSVPLAFAAAIVVSRKTPQRVPADVRRFLVRLHTPEALDLDRG